ncbi:MAG: tripartite tricarboxylate transporter permease [Pseudomonadota bacterium]
MGVFDHIWLGVLAVFQGPPVAVWFPVSITLVMVASGFFTGVAVGATPGLAGPMAMAVSLPILISVFGFEPEAMLPVLGFLIGVMKGATVGGAVPAILFNTPGTPDALLTTFDGHPMTKNGEAAKALKVAHFSSVTGDTFSDIVLFITAPFLAVMVEAYLDLPEKTALILLSMSFIAAVVGDSVAKGLLAAGLGMLAAYIGTGEEFYPRMTGDWRPLANGFPIVSAVLGVLILGEIFKAIEDMMREKARAGAIARPEMRGAHRLKWSEIKGFAPFIATSAAIGTAIGALPGVGSTLAATLGSANGRRLQEKRGGQKFGTGAPEGVAATEAANSAVSGSNLIPVLSLGIPGNAAAVFLILAMDSIGGFNPGPAVFRPVSDGVNPEMVIAFGIFTTMVCANILNWLVGGRIMGMMAIMARIPNQILLPSVLLVTLLGIYAQETSLTALWFAVGFGVLGYLMRKLGVSVLPFVIAFILAGNLETTARQAFSASGGDPWFLFKSPIALAFMVLSLAVILYATRRKPAS